ncbi:MAG: response regulator [Roseomonas sp.]|nr:response regulator [Roseomonas sp.]MCA3653515.1 response regulator [Methylobacterium sp.]MCA3312876.1 response regulator [Roseomonas sp.]MCA3315863.1 response regulator [Roseomonas sp.]MCA3321885.1 response regulator [Roseomonas sp.]
MSHSKHSSPTANSLSAQLPTPLQGVLSAAVLATPTGIVICDPNLPDCPIIYANPAFYRITGYDEEEVIGRNCRFLQGPGTNPRHIKALREAIETGKAIDVEIVNHRKDGSRFVNELHLSPIFDDDGEVRYIFGIQHDVSAREQFARDAERARRAAERANAEKSDFLAFMSHEIRTPMNGVMGTISLLLDTTLDAEQHAYAETARRCGELLLATVNEMLDLSRIEAGHLAIEEEAFDLAAPVAEVLDLLAPAVAEKGIRLSASIDPLLPARVIGDARRLRQILLNLADNAVKFTAVGGVGIRVERAEAPGQVRFVVADTGIGMPPEVQARLFGRFAQAGPETARRYGGSGLGLMICKRLVGLMGGRIVLASSPGKGSTFSFEIPLRPIAESGRPPSTLLPKPAIIKPPPGARGRILIAEDGEANQLVAAAILRKAGYAVDLARDGEEALGAARTAAYDLVLMDVRMPRMDGLAATAAIRGLEGPAGRVPIIAMTAAAMPNEVARCLEAGMDGHVAKPMDLTALLAAVSDILENRPRRSRAAVEEPNPAGPTLIDHTTLQELRAAVGPGRLPRLIGVFADETRARVARLTATDDVSVIEEEAHGLKSAAGTFGAAALRSIASSLEEACVARDMPRVSELCQNLPNLVEKSLAAFPMASGGTVNAGGND